MDKKNINSDQDTSDIVSVIDNLKIKDTVELNIEKNENLAKKNKNKRDENILFVEEGHKYNIKEDENEYTSVTTLIHLNFPKFDADKIIENMMKGKNWKKENKYWGMSVMEIKELWKNNSEEQAKLGTDLHYEIECFMNIDLKEDGKLISYTHEDLLSIYDYEIESGINLNPNNSKEWNYFLKFIKDTPELKPYRTEWKIYHEDFKIAGSIDMVYENRDGSLSIYDWKRSKEISRYNLFKKYACTDYLKNVPDTNFFHYSLQLNLYKFILETKYNKKIKDLFLVRLHPNNKNNSYELIKCKDMSSEIKIILENH